MENVICYAVDNTKNIFFHFYISSISIFTFLTFFAQHSGFNIFCLEKNNRRRGHFRCYSRSELMPKIKIKQSPTNIFTFLMLIAKDSGFKMSFRIKILFFYFKFRLTDTNGKHRRILFIRALEHNSVQSSAASCICPFK